MATQISIDVPEAASVKGRLFLEFCLRYFGPNSRHGFWGRSIRTKEEFAKARKLFRDFYWKNYEDQGGLDARPLIDFQQDLCGAIGMYPLQIRSRAKLSPHEQKMIPLFFRNVEKFFSHESELTYDDSAERAGTVYDRVFHTTDVHEYVSGAGRIKSTKVSHGLIFERGLL